jgi:hypothetical protein
MRSQQSGTHALYSLLEEQARLRKKAEKRAGTAEAEVVRALLEKGFEEAGQKRPSHRVSTSSSSLQTPLAAGMKAVIQIIRSHPHSFTIIQIPFAS